MLHSLPLGRPDGGPVERIQRLQLGRECRMIRTRVPAADGPRFSCRNACGHGADQVQDGLLATGGPTSRALVDGEKHWRTRAEIEGNELAHSPPFATRN